MQLIAGICTFLSACLAYCATEHVSDGNASLARTFQLSLGNRIGLLDDAGVYRIGAPRLGLEGIVGLAPSELGTFAVSVCLARLLDMSYPSVFSLKPNSKRAARLSAAISSGLVLKVL